MNPTHPNPVPSPGPTALIADDEPLLAEALGAELARAWPGLRLLRLVGDGESAVREALAQRPDVLFLDIRMPRLGGLEAAAEVVEGWPADLPLPLIVFVTAYEAHAVQAFEMQAADYLLKPVQPQRLRSTVERLRQRLAERRGGQDEASVDRLRQLLASAGVLRQEPPLTVLQVAAGSDLHFLPVDEVLWFEAADKYVLVITAQRDYLIRTPLRELLPRLDPDRFWQVHRGTVVQANAIEAASRDEAGRWTLRMRGRPERLAVSRLHAGRFKPL